MGKISDYYNEHATEDYNNQVDRLLKYFPKNIRIGKDHAVRNITIQVTEECNLRCSYCYQINKSKEN